MAEPPPSEFNPTGVWLEYWPDGGLPPSDLIKEFASRGGKGIILGRVLSNAGSAARTLEESQYLGLQTVVMVESSDLDHTESYPLRWLLEAADAVLISISNRDVPNAKFDVAQQSIESQQVSEAPEELSFQLPDKPWFLEVPSFPELRPNWRDIYSGPPSGFMFRETSANAPIASPQAAADSVIEWVKTLEGLRPTFYSFSLGAHTISPQSILEIPAATAAVADTGVTSIVASTLLYTNSPELRDALEALADFPNNLPSKDDEPIVEWNSGQSLVVSLAVTPDGQQLVSGGDDGTINVWEIDSGLRVTELTGHQNQVNSIAMTTEGQYDLPPIFVPVAMLVPQALGWALQSTRPGVPAACNRESCGA